MLLPLHQAQKTSGLPSPILPPVATSKCFFTPCRLECLPNPNSCKPRERFIAFHPCVRRDDTYTHGLHILIDISPKSRRRGIAAAAAAVAEVLTLAIVVVCWCWCWCCCWCSCSCSCPCPCPCSCPCPCPCPCSCSYSCCCSCCCCCC